MARTPLTAGHRDHAGADLGVVDDNPFRVAFLQAGDDRARALRDPMVVQRRRALLAAEPPYMAPLLAHVAALRRLRPDWEVPDADPAGGGVDARALFLLEKPARGTTASRSGFVSIQNDTATGAAMHGFLQRRGIPTHWCLLANVVPWWDGSIIVSAEQRRLAGSALRELLALMGHLRAIVLVGATAQRAWARTGSVAPPGTRLFRSDHPSPQVRAAFRSRWEAIPACWPDRAMLQDGAATVPEAQRA